MLAVLNSLYIDNQQYLSISRLLTLPYMVVVVIYIARELIELYKILSLKRNSWPVKFYRDKSSLWPYLYQIQKAQLCWLIISLLLEAISEIIRIRANLDDRSQGGIKPF